MRDSAKVLRERAALDHDLLQLLKRRASAPTAQVAYSHGNYLPALDAALALLLADSNTQNQLFLIFLSDGAPSDHNDMACSHGSYVWKKGWDGEFIDCSPVQEGRKAGRQALTCRRFVKDGVQVGRFSGHRKGLFYSILNVACFVIFLLFLAACSEGSAQRALSVFIVEQKYSLSLLVHQKTALAEGVCICSRVAHS